MTDHPNRSLERGFLSDEERAISAAFLEAGYVVLNAADRDALDRVRETAARALRAALAEDGVAAESNAIEHLFEQLHERLSVETLNAVRIATFEAMNADPDFRRNLFHAARPWIECLAGSELAMQRRVNLSIQYPGDDSALLPVHADVLNGDSPFEIVQWVPLVDCAGTKSMFLFPPALSADVLLRIAREGIGDPNDLVARHADEIDWIEAPYGTIVLFDQTLLHGNVVNRESQTRVSLNCRYKGLFTPYSDKLLGEFFEPITLRAASRIGLDHRFPAVFGPEGTT